MIFWSRKSPFPTPPCRGGPETGSRSPKTPKKGLRRPKNGLFGAFFRGSKRGPKRGQKGPKRPKPAPPYLIKDYLSCFPPPKIG